MTIALFAGGTMKPTLLAVLTISISASLIAQQHQHGMGSAGLGMVNFATSCAPAVQPDFNRAVALLHSFEYGASRDVFLKVAEQDKTCAMAHWGAAMTYFHGAWGEVDHAKGAPEAAKARELATTNPKTTPREKDYIDAVSAIYSDPNASIIDRAKNLADHMAQVHAANPTDDEAAIFYAVALFDSAGRDKTYANQ